MKLPKAIMSHHRWRNVAHLVALLLILQSSISLASDDCDQDAVPRIEEFAPLSISNESPMMGIWIRFKTESPDPSAMTRVLHQTIIQLQPSQLPTRYLIDCASQCFPFGGKWGAILMWIELPYEPLAQDQSNLAPSIDAITFNVTARIRNSNSCPFTAPSSENVIYRFSGISFEALHQDNAKIQIALNPGTSARSINQFRLIMNQLPRVPLELMSQKTGRRCVPRAANASLMEPFDELGSASGYRWLVVDIPRSRSSLGCFHSDLTSSNHEVETTLLLRSVDPRASPEPRELAWKTFTTYARPWIPYDTHSLGNEMEIHDSHMHIQFALMDDFADDDRIRGLHLAVARVNQELPSECDAPCILLDAEGPPCTIRPSPQCPHGLTCCSRRIDDIFASDSLVSVPLTDFSVDKNGMMRGVVNVTWLSGAGVPCKIAVDLIDPTGPPHINTELYSTKYVLHIRDTFCVN